MKRIFTLLTALVLVATCIFAQKHSLKRSNEVAGSSSQHRFGIPDKSSERNLLQQRKDIEKRANQTKSAQAIKQRLDSYSSDAYDAITGQWIPDEKAEFIYDANMNMTMEYDYEWDNSTSQLVKYWKGEYTYDGDGNLIQELYSELNTLDNEFYISGKNLFTYDANGNQLQQIEYSYDTAISQFVINYKSDYTYDASGNRTQIINYYLDESNMLVGSWKSDLAYNENGNETQRIDSYWDGTTWVQARKYESSYNSSGNKALYTQSDWDEFNGKWNDAIEKVEYSYNSNGNLILEQQFSKDPNNNNWILQSKDDYMFDASGNNTQHINYYGWDETTGKWTEVWKSDYTINTNYTFDDLILPFWLVEDEEDIFKNMITEIKDYTWNTFTLEWNEEYRLVLNYSEQNFTSVNHREKGIVNVFPNPFTESLTINVPSASAKITLDLFDQQGRKLMTRLIMSDQKVSLQGLNKGMYVYRLNVDGKIQSGKLVKE